MFKNCWVWNYTPVDIQGLQISSALRFSDSTHRPYTSNSVARFNAQFNDANSAPSYVADEFHQSSDVDARRCLRSASSSSLVVRRTHKPTVIESFPFVGLQTHLCFNHRRPSFSGRRFPAVNHCRRTSRRRRHWLSSGNVWKPISSIVPAPNPLWCPLSDLEALKLVS